MAITYVDELIHDMVTTSDIQETVSLPTSLENDVWIVEFAYDDFQNTNFTQAEWALDNGWTAIDNDSGGSDLDHALLWKFMGATPDTSIKIETGDGSGDGYGTVIGQLWRGGDILYALYDAVGIDTGVSGDPSNAAVTTSRDNALVLAFAAGSDDSGTVNTVPTGYTNLTENTTGSGTSGDATLAVTSKIIATAGSETPGAWVWDDFDDWWEAWTIVIEPPSPVVTALVVSSTFPAVTTANEVNATATLTALLVTSTFDSPTAVGEVNATVVQPALVVTGSFPGATAIGEVNATGLLTALVVTGTFDAVTAVGVSSATAVLSTLAVSGTFDPVVALGEVNDTATLTALIVASTFDPVVTANNVNATTALTVLAVTSTFDPVTVVNEINATTTLTALSVLATFDPVTVIGEVNATSPQTTLAVLATFDPVVTAVDKTVAVTALVVQGTFDAVTVASEINATTTVTALVVTGTFDAVIAAVLNTYLRPVADTSAAGWESAPTGGQDLWAQIDEVVADDADYIYAEDPNP